MEKIEKWYEKDVKWGFFIKLILVVNFLFMAFWFKVCWIRMSQDEEHFEYDEYLERRIETQSKIIETQDELIKTYRKLVNSQK